MILGLLHRRYFFCLWVLGEGIAEQRGKVVFIKYKLKCTFARVLLTGSYLITDKIFLL